MAKPGIKPRPVADRFWPKVAVAGPDECWLWKAQITPAGYGQIGVGSLSDGTRGYALAHRMSYELAHGPIPHGMFVCHRCDVRNCVNPAHLFVGTHSDNMRDCSRKGRLNHWSARKAACKHGHPFNEENTAVVSGKRVCRTCRTEARRRFEARQKEMAAHV